MEINMEKFKPVIKDYPHLLHGGDYNPDQWKKFPEVINDDMKFFGLAGVNTVSIGIFSWVEFEPEDGVYNFDFFDTIMDELAARGIKACFATPSAGKPAWISEKYPDILPVGANGVRARRGGRLEFCKSSPDFRRKIHDLNTELAKHYADHPALGMWHISNECCGVCFCDRCEAGFREWLKKKYKTLDKLNDEYWNGFWGHTYTSWDQIEAPKTEHSIHALTLDWGRYTNELLADYIAWEAEPLRKYTPNVPITTNMMQTVGIDYKKVAEKIDVVSWDSYPLWHYPNGGQLGAAISTAFWHDRFRAMSDKPFMLMECTPSLPSWSNVNKLKRPGMHKLASLQAIAHGSESVQYFQWRKSRGGFEKFHGAVIDHYGKADTRVFREVAEVGKTLAKLDAVVGTRTVSRVAIIHDAENSWAIDEMAGARKPKRYEGLCHKFYKPLWNMGIACDVIESNHSLDGYDLVIAPALYLASDETIDKLEKFVKRGGTLVSTYLTGWVDENDLCRLGGFPGGKLREVFGVWSEELDTLYDGESNKIKLDAKLDGLKDEYDIVEYCDLIHAEGARVLGHYTSDFYADEPCLTVNEYGEGRAYYIAFGNSGDFMNDLVRSLCSDMGIAPCMDTTFPEGVTATMRTDGERDYIFVQNYNDVPVEIRLDSEYEDLLNGGKLDGTLTLDKFGVQVLGRSVK